MKDILLYTGVSYALIHLTASLRTLVLVTQASGGFPAVDPRAPHGTLQILTRWMLCILLGPVGWFKRAERWLGLDPSTRALPRQCGFCAAELLRWQSVCPRCFADLSLASQEALPGFHQIRLVSEVSRRMAARDCAWAVLRGNFLLAVVALQWAMDSEVFTRMLPETCSIALMWTLGEAFSGWRDRKGLLLARLERGVLIREHVSPTLLEIASRISLPVSTAYLLASLGSPIGKSPEKIAIGLVAFTLLVSLSAYPAWKVLREKLGGKKVSYAFGPK